MQKQNKKGFTLSETLITLGVLGIIIACTIPTLIAETNKAAYVDGLKKADLILKTATGELMLDNGGSMISVATTEDALMNKYCTKLNCLKKCNTGFDSGVCWHKANQWSELDGGLINSDLIVSGSRAILSNGMLIFFFLEPPKGACTYNFGFGATICGEIRIDTNGFKKPNQLGRDIFYYWILKNGAKPRGAAGAGEWWTADCISQLPPTLNGITCAGRVLVEGKMSY